MANNTKHCEIGMIGLGVMGRNLLLNIAEHGHSVAGYDTDLGKVKMLSTEATGHQVYAAQSIPEFISSLASPRIVMMLVPAGAPVDAVVKELLPYLQEGDIIIDGGNSYYKDTEVRTKNLLGRGIHFIGVGISGGEEGARKGPSIMPGGSKEAYAHIRPIFEDCAAKVNGEPCVAYLGPNAAGHFVKMVHNGIEYGLMQLISETYDLFKRGLGLNDSELQKIYTAWNETELNSYLVEITGKIFGKIDEKTRRPLIDEILDAAKQLGTGRWTSQSAMDLNVPTPTINQAVVARNMSMLEAERKQASKILKHGLSPFKGNSKDFIANLQKALYAAMLITYAQGFALLSVASERYNYQLDLNTIARIWRGGCIIRAQLLENIREAYKKNPRLPNFLLDQSIAQQVSANIPMIRGVAVAAVNMGIPAPCFMASLNYFEGYSSAWLPGNLIQAQRDFFGAHTYERIDEKGTFHTNWEDTQIYDQTKNTALRNR